MRTSIKKFVLRIRSNPKLISTIAGTIVAIAAHNKPEWFGWLPKEAQQQLQMASYLWLNGGVQIALAWWAKQHNATGQT